MDRDQLEAAALAWKVARHDAVQARLRLEKMVLELKQFEKYVDALDHDAHMANTRLFHLIHNES